MTTEAKPIKLGYFTLSKCKKSPTGIFPLYVYTTYQKKSFDVGCP